VKLVMYAFPELRESKPEVINCFRFETVHSDAQ